MKILKYLFKPSLFAITLALIGGLVMTHSIRETQAADQFTKTVMVDLDLESVKYETNGFRWNGFRWNGFRWNGYHPSIDSQNLILQKIASQPLVN